MRASYMSALAVCLLVVAVALFAPSPSRAFEVYKHMDSPFHDWLRFPTDCYALLVEGEEVADVDEQAWKAMLEYEYRTAYHRRVADVTTAGWELTLRLTFAVYTQFVPKYLAKMDDEAFVAYKKRMHDNGCPLFSDGSPDTRNPLFGFSVGFTHGGADSAFDEGMSKRYGSTFTRMMRAKVPTVPQSEQPIGRALNKDEIEEAFERAARETNTENTRDKTDDLEPNTEVPVKGLKKKTKKKKKSLTDQQGNLDQQGGGQQFLEVYGHGKHDDEERMPLLGGDDDDEEPGFERPTSPSRVDGPEENVLTGQLLGAIQDDSFRSCQHPGRIRRVVSSDLSALQSRMIVCGMIRDFWMRAATYYLPSGFRPYAARKLGLSGITPEMQYSKKKQKKMAEAYGASMCTAEEAVDPLSIPLHDFTSSLPAEQPELTEETCKRLAGDGPIRRLWKDATSDWESGDEMEEEEEEEEEEDDGAGPSSKKPTPKKKRKKKAKKKEKEPSRKRIFGVCYAWTMDFMRRVRQNYPDATMGKAPDSRESALGGHDLVAMGKERAEEFCLHDYQEGLTPTNMAGLTGPNVRPVRTLDWDGNGSPVRRLTEEENEEALDVMRRHVTPVSTPPNGEVGSDQANM